MTSGALTVYCPYPRTELLKNSCNLACSNCLSGNFVAYSAMAAGDVVRAKAYSTTSTSLPLQSMLPILGFSCGLLTSRSSASR